MRRDAEEAAVAATAAGEGDVGFAVRGGVGVWAVVARGMGTGRRRVVVVPAEAFDWVDAFVVTGT